MKMVKLVTLCGVAKHGEAGGQLAQVGFLSTMQAPGFKPVSSGLAAVSFLGLRRHLSSPHLFLLFLSALKQHRCKVGP